MGNDEWERGMGIKISFWLEKSFYSLKTVFEKCAGQFHLKAHLHSLIPPFTKFATQSVKRGMSLWTEILNIFFVRNLFRTWIILKSSQCHESQYLHKAYSRNLIPPFTESVTQSFKRATCLYVGILNTFLAENLVRAWMLFEMFSVTWKSIST